MSACIYHHCQTCKATSYYLGANGRSLGEVVAHCLDCGAPMKPVTRHGLPHIVCKYWHVRGNYKKLQQAKCSWNNTKPNYGQRMKRMGLSRK